MFGRQQRVNTPAKMTLAEAQRIVNEYGTALASKKSMVNDASGLPYSKSKIKAALISAIVATEDEVMRSNLKAGYIALADWQDGIGSRGQLLDATEKELNDDPLGAAKRISTGAPEFTETLARIQAESQALVDELTSLGLWSGGR
jgi:uncharacterized protein (DUF2141 family)